MAARCDSTQVCGAKNVKESGIRPRTYQLVVVGRVVAALIVLVVFILPFGSFVGGPTLLRSYDRSHVITPQCTVASAEVNNTSPRSPRGIGASGVEIVLATNGPSIEQLRNSFLGGVMQGAEGPHR